MSKDGNKWFYVDIDSHCHIRIAVKAPSELLARQYADDLVAEGSVDPCEFVDNAYGSEKLDVRVGDVEPKRPPRNMLRFREIRFGEVERMG